MICGFLGTRRLWRRVGFFLIVVIVAAPVIVIVTTAAACWTLLAGAFLNLFGRLLLLFLFWLLCTFTSALGSGCWSGLVRSDPDSSGRTASNVL